MRKLKIFLIIVSIIFFVSSYGNCIWIVLDPGHGGTDVGGGNRWVSGEYIKESDINLQVNQIVRDYLYYSNWQSPKTGIEYIETRKQDVKRELYERVNTANEKADSTRLNVRFVSIHHNTYTESQSLPSEGQHTLTLYDVVHSTTDNDTDLGEFANQPRIPAVRTQSSSFAAKLSEWIQKRLGYPKKTDYMYKYVIRNTIVPSSISEASFLSNDDEALLLKTNVLHRQNEAYGIFMGIIDHLGLKSFIDQQNQNYGSNSQTRPPNSETGKLSITTNSRLATFTVYGPRGTKFSSSDINWTTTYPAEGGKKWELTPVPAGDYTVDFDDIKDCQSLPSIQGTLNPDGTLSFTGQYISITTQGTDTTPPIGKPSAPVLLDDKANTLGDYWNGETFTVKLSPGGVYDSESQIIGYYLEVIGYESNGDIGSVAFAGKTLSNTPNVGNIYKDLTYKARVRVMNSAGLYSECSDYSNAVTIDLTPPTGTLVLNEGNYFTGSTQISVKINDSSIDTEKIQFSDDGLDGRWSEFETFKMAGNTWTLNEFISDTNGVKGIFVRLLDKAGNLSEVMFGKIYLDLSDPNSPPKPSCSSILYTSQAGKRYSKLPLTFEWSQSSDLESGITGYHLQVSKSDTDWSKDNLVFSQNVGNVTTYTLPSSVTLTEGTEYFARIASINGAGRQSTYADISEIIIDNTPPTVTLQFYTDTDGKLWIVLNTPYGLTVNPDFRHISFNICTIAQLTQGVFIVQKTL